MRMATHGLIIVETKADNELALSLTVYFKSVKKWKYVLRKKKAVKKKFPMAGVGPWTFDMN